MTIPPPLDPATQALFLDFDGTLVGFADDPLAVRIEPPVLARLLQLGDRLGGALAMVSGRRIADLDRFLAPLAFAAAGVHGLERRLAPNGPVTMLAGSETLAGPRAVIRAAIAGEPGLTLEDKGTALVLHYRAAPHLEPLARAVMAQAAGTREDLSVLVGNCIVEMHPAGMDKGRAVADFLGRAPFAGRVPVYLGDDTTDEFALAYVREIGGVSIKVGPGDSVAAFRLADVASVHRWLGAPVAAPLPAA